jgi:DsbC/DsbD-like thiol-disulfide interchange protein
MLVTTMPRYISTALLALVIFTGLQTTASAQIHNGKRVVEASLIADTEAIVPGRPFTAGLLLKMAPGWHTYWQYPGDSGLPTKIDWHLPRGFKAGAIQWPLPEKITEDGDLVTYGYRDEVLLLVDITPPEKIDTQKITLVTKASWLVCEKLCIPGNADVALILPVAAQNHSANDALFKKYRAQLPRIGAESFTYQWESKSDRAIFRITGQDGYPRTIDFYPLPASGTVIGHPEINRNNGDQITIPITSGKSDQLAGVLVIGEGEHRTGDFIPPQSSAPPSSARSTLNSQPSTLNLLRYLILGFFGGMLLNVMPCVLPVITLKIYGFINQSGQSRRRILELGLAYCAGVFAWFLGLAALIVVFGLNWSFQFQSKGFIGAMLVICVVFGLNLVGAFELMLPGSLNTKLANAASKEGLGGAFVHGLFTTLMGSACTAPLLGPAVGFALAQPPVIILSFFATIAAGMALPYFLLTLNPGWMQFLPKPGMWMVRVKQIMGVLVLATALWFGHVLWRQVTAQPVAFKPALEAALKSGRTVFVDFTADWCINCKVNEKLVLDSAAVQEALKKDNVFLLKADWTNGDADITALLKQFGRGGVPAYVIYPAKDTAHPVVLPELLTQQIVLDALAKAKTAE